ncbi:MAG TPA: hypothetical protein VFG81_01905 [Anaerolineales bacterium]|nr:hypothetical protein [Anaerolineales bacterium]
MANMMFRSFLILILMLGYVRPAQALAPNNDHLANAMMIPALPFSISVDLSEATLEPGEPQSCEQADRTVWYTLTPSSTMTMIADVRLGNNPKVSIYRATGSGFANLEHIQCVSPGGAVTFLAEQGQTYYIQVGAVVGTPGAVQFNLAEVIGIRGRLIDAVTSMPLSGDVPTFATATLLRVCGDDCLEYVRSVAAFSDGAFRMDSFPGEEIPAGTYMIEATAIGYQTSQFGPYEFTGENLDVGDLTLEPFPLIGSIQGRVLDQITGVPVAEVFTPAVELYRCYDGICSEFVNWQLTDSDGRFRFEMDNAGNRITAGTYLIVAYADQYQYNQTQLLEVGKDEEQNVGNVRIRSYPLRFSDLAPCPDLPASGGECEYSVKIWNGLGSRLESDAWSIAASVLPDSLVDFTEFQTKMPVALTLEKGKSKVVRFRFDVPAGNGSVELGVCTRLFVGRGGNASFNTIGFRDLFCMLRNAGGFAAAPPPASAEKVSQPAAVTASAMEAETNNSCQEAQDVGAVALPFTMDDSLDSSLASDIDFYRFRGTPGAPLIIDLEGASNGKGTLGDPLLGAFDSNCNLIASNDDHITYDSHLVLAIPEDGIVILAATAYPDSEFLGGGSGSYQLTLTTYTPAGPITGTVIDGATGESLPGDSAPFAFVYLQRCDEFGCFDINGHPAASDGSFRFDGDVNGVPLTAGDYMVVAVGEQYQVGQSERFTLGEGEEANLGTLALTSFPVRFSAINGCSIPAQGGICKVSVTISNRLSTRISGKVWNIVYGFGIGSFADFTTFQPDTPRGLRLDPGQSRTLQFQFRVSGNVADGAAICPIAYMGQEPNVFFTPVGRSLFFCLVKGDDGFKLTAPQDAHMALRSTQNMGPAQTLPKKIK